MGIFTKEQAPAVTLAQYDAATAALYQHVTGKPVGGDFPGFDYDRWYVLARVVLEGAGVRVP